MSKIVMNNVISSFQTLKVFKNQSAFKLQILLDFLKSENNDEINSLSSQNEEL